MTTPTTPLVPCPFCGCSDGYTIADGTTYRWWNVLCKTCGRSIGECHSDRRAQLGTVLPERWPDADREWNEAGAHAKSLRDALVPLANAASPTERETLTDEDSERAQRALCGAAVVAERERCNALADALQACLQTLQTLQCADYEDGGAALKHLIDRCALLVWEVKRGPNVGAKRAP